MRVMRAMVFEAPHTPLAPRERPMPQPAAGEILIEIEACGVCRTDLHVVDGELPNPKLPVVPGHEIVGRVAALGEGVTGIALGARVGVPWLGATCGVCPYCRSERENLCDAPLFTGYTRDGGYASHTVADVRYAFPLAEGPDAASLAPLLCAGLIGWRSLRMAGEGESAGPLRLWRRRPHPRASRGLAGPARLRLHARAATRRRKRLPARSARVWAGSVGGSAARAARCRHHLRAGRRARARCAARGQERRARGLRRHPHVGHPELSLSLLVGRAPPARRSPISRAQDASRIPRSSRRKPACARMSRVIRSRAPTRRSPTCARHACRARPC